MNKSEFWIGLLLLWVATLLVIGVYTEFGWLIHLFQHLHISFT
jgi:hypothetical protein